MKKKIGLWILLLCELFIMIVYGFYSQMGSPTYFKIIYDCGYFFHHTLIASINKLIRLNNQSFGELVSALIINVCFIIVYYLIFGIIGLIIKNSKKKKINRVIKNHYVLNDNEKEKFNYKNYLKRFPIRRVLSLIIPLAFIAIIIITRLDRSLCEQYNVQTFGKIDFFTNFISPNVTKFFKNSPTYINKYLLLFHNNKNIGYFDLINKLPKNLFWVEIIVGVLASLLILFVWYLLLTLIYLPFRKLCAKKKAKKMCNAYILKKDYAEYKLRIRHRDEYSSKSEEFMNIVEEEKNEEQPLAIVKNAPKLKKVNINSEEYYDDLGSGVKDLGVGEIVEEKNDTAHIEREVRYISDKDFDIILDNEPVIEVVEDDGLDQILQQTKEDELFYEKYQPDEVEIKDYPEYSKDQQEVNDYVSSFTKEEKVDLVKEENVNHLMEEEKIEETPVEKEEILDVEKVDSSESKEETKKDDPIDPIIESKDEIKNEEKEEIDLSTLSPLQRYRYEKEMAKKQHDELEKQGLLNEKNDPMNKYKISKSKGETKIPSLKNQNKK